MSWLPTKLHWRPRHPCIWTPCRLRQPHRRAALSSGRADSGIGLGIRQWRADRPQWILNSDGTLNSPTNPAAPGSAITIFMAGEGQYTLTDGYAVVSQPSALF